MRRELHLAKLSLIILEAKVKPLIGRSWFDPLGIKLSFIDAVDREIQAAIKVRLETAEHVPVVSKARQLPFALMPVVKDKLEDLKARGIIESVTNPKFASPIVVAEKPNGGHRVCGD